MPESSRQILEDIYRAAVAAANPAAELTRVLEETRPQPAGGLFLVALGKASPGMSEAAPIV